MPRTILITRLFFFPLISASLLACHATEKKQKEAVADFKTLDTVVTFSGFWLNEVYLKNIERSKSPRSCQNLLESCIKIPARTLQATTMVAGFHEGGPDLTVLKNENKFQLYYRFDDTIRNLAYDIQVISNKKIKIGNNTFVKTNEKFLEDILFSGEYVDSIKNKIQFLKDGHITGLDTFTIYDPIYDYTDPAMDVDQIGLGRNPNNMTYFGFKFDKDTLLIYKLDCLEKDSAENTCMKVKLGDIKYKLTRIH